MTLRVWKWIGAQCNAPSKNGVTGYQNGNSSATFTTYFLPLISCTPHVFLHRIGARKHEAIDDPKRQRSDGGERFAIGPARELAPRPAKNPESFSRRARAPRAGTSTARARRAGPDAVSRLFHHRISRCPAKKMPGRVGARRRQKDVHDGKYIPSLDLLQ
jgi:hypothetical protein